MVQKAQKEGISSHNIENVWRAIGFMPYHPAIILKKLEIREKYAPTNTGSLMSILEHSQPNIFFL